jgi:hypothetical protein
VERLEVLPRDIVLDTKGKHRLLVTAHLSDGKREDYTDRVIYEPNSPEVVQVNSDGVVEARRPGEAAVIVRSPGAAGSVRVGVILHPVRDYPHAAQNNLVDEYVFAKLRRFQVIPSAQSTDAEFLRRVCLDVTGTLPPASRVREFLSSRDPDKRNKVVEILLSSPEYVDFWTFRFSDLFRVKSSEYWEWVRSTLELNKPYDEVARERIAARGFDGAAEHFSVDDGQSGPAKRMAEEVRVFMGRRIDCAQCHNHPYDTWSQDQFWGLTAFFAQQTAVRWNEDFRERVIIDDRQGSEMLNGEAGKKLLFVKAIHPRTKKEVPPTFPGGKVVPEDERADLRMELAKWMTSQPEFAEAAVNRMWGYFFGRGIVDPVDDFRLANPPTHPELLEALANDFQDHGYDLKHLIRLIVESRTYQLSSIPNETNKFDSVNYSHSFPRLLGAEVLLDAISQVTGIPESFESGVGRAPLGTRAINLEVPGKYQSRFLEVYGRSLRDALPETANKPNIQQALNLLAGTVYTEKLSKPGGRIEQLLKTGASDKEITQELYLAAISRFPNESEQSEGEKIIAGNSSRREAVEDLLWALIASREFVYNH